MTEWREIRLGNIATISWGDTTKTKAAYTESGFVAYSASGPDGFMDHFDHEGPGVVLSAIGAQCGKTWFAKGKWSCIKNTIFLKARQDAIEPRFLYFLTANPGIWPIRGAAQPFISQSDAKGIPLKIPSLPTQRRIASILSAYDDLIENNTRRIAILEEMARRIYQEWFVRFRFPGHENVRMVKSELGLVPEGWRVETLGDVCARMNSGNTPSRSNNDFWNGGTVDWYKTKELWDGFLFTSEERVTEAAVNAKKTRVFEAGTILMAIYGSPTVGRLGITTRRSSCNQAALGLTPNPERITFWMLYFTLLALRTEFNNKAQGAAQQNISKEKVEETAFVLPAMSVQERFEEMVAPIRELCRALQEKNTNLHTTRDLLLPKLISGELDVSTMPDPESAAA